MSTLNSLIRIDDDVCTGCGSCVDECSRGCLCLSDGRAAVTGVRCMECGHCIAVCPAGAVWLEGYSPEDVVPIDKSLDISPEAMLYRVKSRRSVRHFTADPVPQGDLMTIIEAGRFAPSGKNRQKNRFIVSEHPDTELEPEALEVFKRVMPGVNIQSGFFFHHAPAVILVVSTDTVDAALASAYMELMAESLGYGVLYVGYYARAVRSGDTLRAQLGLAEGEQIVTALAIGRPAVHFVRTVPRKAPAVTWISRDERNT